MQGDGAARATRQHLPAGKVRTLGSRRRNCTSSFQALVKSRSSPSSRIANTALAREDLQKQKQKELHSGCLTARACLQATSWVRRSGHPHPCPSACPQPAAAPNSSGVHERWCLPLTSREFFFSVFLCSILLCRSLSRRGLFRLTL